MKSAHFLPARGSILVGIQLAGVRAYPLSKFPNGIA